MSSLNVNDVPLLIEPDVTETFGPLAAPLIAPLPVILQEWVTVPPVGVTADVYVCVDISQTGLSPVILQTGTGFTVTLTTQVENSNTCPLSALIFNCTVKLLAPTVTLMEPTSEATNEPATYQS